ncbi:hypothetical protein GALMADRAFT_259341 [Galerina marginata CBS 339.88]|uniref:60S acidic ribosomal protein P1 n=1 Tax=Galerina marginata (strain CBS 339.88) TaxID=685588 RepID=A0A067S6N2_GALM3|nr:hypothetical protein GALMADRAFT_259341 [Galerina marginata CBS 339.88]
MASTGLAAIYAALILADEGIEITVRHFCLVLRGNIDAHGCTQADKIIALTNAAGVELEPIWATLLEKALAGKNIMELLTDIGARGASASGGSAVATAATSGESPPAAPNIEEKEENEGDDSDDDLGITGFLLFD